LIKENKAVPVVADLAIKAQAFFRVRVRVRLNEWGALEKNSQGETAEWFRGG
jgi:hypothetical protein